MESLGGDESKPCVLHVDLPLKSAVAAKASELLASEVTASPKPGEGWTARVSRRFACIFASGRVLPSEVESVVAAADRDRAGQRVAWQPGRLFAEGRHVGVVTPNGSGDFNDVLRSRRPSHA